MEISGNNPLIGSNKNVQRLDLSQQSEKTKTRDTTSSDSDQIELSVRSLEISHIEDLIRSTPDVREDRVNQVRGQIESGIYNVKAEQIADKIIGGSLLDSMV
jgi:negative regulator of flagellin synthesis FlgM